MQVLLVVCGVPLQRCSSWTLASKAVPFLASFDHRDNSPLFEGAHCSWLPSHWCMVLKVCHWIIGHSSLFSWIHCHCFGNHFSSNTLYVSKFFLRWSMVGPRKTGFWPHRFALKNNCLHTTGVTSNWPMLKVRSMLMLLLFSSGREEL